ncbi:hemolysin family protein [Rudaea sp.]|uniref:hemolysin family protein n=1 Tax=Rudaea sp. TaxID=2136325 RepID=UPI00321F902C
METLSVDLWRIAAVLLLVFANGFFVAAEFSLVSVRRSRVAELVALGRTNAAALHRAVDRLDAYLAATQLGITISSLALGWIGEPALAHLIEPLLAPLGDTAAAASHAIAVAIAFVVITALHIVLGELAPKSLALQRSERTALLVVRPLAVFLFVFRPAILALNGLGNGVLRLFGLRAGSGEEGALHSPDELRMLVAESRRAGLLQLAQQEVVERTFNLGTRRVRDIMTIRPDVEWIDADDTRAAMLSEVRRCRHEQLLFCRGGIDEVLGVVHKRDLLDQALDGAEFDPQAVALKPFVVHEATPIFKVIEEFRTRAASTAIVMDEYGTLGGIVTRTDLLEAIAGDVADKENESDILARKDGSFLIDGLAAVADVFDRLGIRRWPQVRDFNTLAGFALQEFGSIPVAGEAFAWEGWRFEVVDMDGHRIDKLLAMRVPEARADGDEDAPG